MTFWRPMSQLRWLVNESQAFQHSAWVRLFATRRWALILLRKGPDQDKYPGDMLYGDEFA